MDDVTGADLGRRSIRGYAVLALAFLWLLSSCEGGSRNWDDQKWEERSRTISCGTGTISHDEREAQIRTLVLHEQAVVASTQHGFYRASLHDQEWQAIECNAWPFTGELLKTYDESLLYLLPTSRLPNKMGAIQGTSYPEPIEIVTPVPPENPEGNLFISTDQGVTWYSVTDEYQFLSAFLHPDGTLYGIVNTPIPPPNPDDRSIPWFVYDSEGRGYFVRDRALMSEDYGKTWQDITGDIGVDVQLLYFFEDPNAPWLAALSGNFRRNYIFTAENKDYSWQGKVAFGHEMYFLPKDPAQRSTTLKATLSNYFAYDFGDEVELPLFSLDTEYVDYRYTMDEPKNVLVTLNVLDDAGSGMLVDVEPAEYFWYVHAIDPMGHRTIGFSPPWQNRRTVEQIKAAKQVYCRETIFQYHDVEPA